MHLSNFPSFNPELLYLLLFMLVPLVKDCVRAHKLTVLVCAGGVFMVFYVRVPWVPLYSPILGYDRPRAKEIER